jgi:diadenosine tetraphosphate (Ap4A) HIT family hydrolase
MDLVSPSWIPPQQPVPGCELCARPGGQLVMQAVRWRLIRVNDPDFPVFYRVVWQAHASELSDLSPDGRLELLDVLTRVEQVLRERLQPDKINLASLGNVVPHLHWHVIGRYGWDSHFPQPIWGARQREVDPPALQRLPLPLAAVDQALREALAGMATGR